ncbi:Ig-like domain-containing protein [Solirubrobacter phytolaccae]|uniref:Ig-like domain-containing protein n=1 Tax=Solirubrobacter phytolaccae TaxID=1404360 RepID=A0A9X3NEY9_9ACTN|nr:Ig-like domain-containing protein [Solirubrobacter phytolaccae]MDA0184801.1 Ig-like domain-containing protein [Solirubrobacter phytolaccae]
MCVSHSLVGSLTAVVLLVGAERATAQSTTATTVVVPATEPVHGETVAMTATVSNVSAPATAPVGFVRFHVDDRQVGPLITLTDRVAQTNTRPLPAGRHVVKAEFVPRGPFAASTGTTELAVARASTTTTVRIAPASPVTGETLSIDAAVAPTTPPLGMPTGVVSVVIDGAAVVPMLLGPDGIARGVTRLAAATHTVVLTYEGDPNHVGSSGSGAVVVTKAGTAVALSAQPNPAVLEQEVMFSVSVVSLTPSAWWPSGVLTAAVDGIAVAGSAEIIGQGEGADFWATFETPGTHVATAHFTGNQHFLAADAAVRVTVRRRGLAAARRPLARGLTLRAVPRRDRRKPYAFAVSGVVQLPDSVAKADGCSGKVTLEAKLKARRVARTTATVTSACTYRATLSSSRAGTVAITAAFAGNASVGGVSARVVKVRAG